MCIYLFVCIYSLCMYVSAFICLCMYTQVCVYVELKLRIQELFFLLLKCPAKLPHPFLLDIDVF